MKLKNKKVGFVLTGSFCTFKVVKEQLKNIVNEGADVIPIMSDHSYELDTKFGSAKEHIEFWGNHTLRESLYNVGNAES